MSRVAPSVGFMLLLERIAVSLDELENLLCN